MEALRGAMSVPDVHYARNGDVAIAYQVVGDGPDDLVFSHFLGNIRWAWELPLFVRFYERLSSFCRLILFDKRGTGLSDQAEPLTFDAQMDDLRAVLDAVQSERAALYGGYEAGQLCLLFAATYPERVSSVVLFNTAARLQVVGRHEQLEAIRRGTWGRRDWTAEAIRRLNPSLAHDPDYLDWVVWWVRLGASPGAALKYYEMLQQTDIRPVLPVIRVPTLALYRSKWRDAVLETAEAIPNAEALEIPGTDAGIYIGDEPVSEAERFLTGLVAKPVPETVLTTVLFTDIVGSTEHAVRLGDRGWRDLLERHHAGARRELARFRGSEVDTAGDGLFATFDGPARAIRCGQAIEEDARRLGLDLRLGVHTGECELRDGSATGVAVHIGARVVALAGPGEVLVSSTVKDLVAGSGIEFEDRGEHELRGVPGEWRIYAVR
jgi:class 3 adenylate cyclase